jgi:hypothetical protein
MDSVKVEKLTVDNVEDAFEYHPWDEEQQKAGAQVRSILTRAAVVIMQEVPDCPDRSVALRKIREARMDANSAITHRGKF